MTVFAEPADAGAKYGEMPAMGGGAPTWLDDRGRTAPGGNGRVDGVVLGSLPSCFQMGTNS
jgi:hypothetical protein